MSTKQHRNLTLESLEDRKLMAAKIELGYDGEVDVVGSSGDDTIQINYEYHSRLRVVTGVQISMRTESGQYYSETFDINRVSKINIDGYWGDDYIRNNTGITTSMMGQGGNDTLIGGSGKDVLRGGNGND